MSDVSFSGVKIHNELEYCVVENPSIRKQIKSLFLSHRISYFEKWDDPSFLVRLLTGATANRCIICINEMQKEKADELLMQYPELKNGVSMIGKRVGKTYF